MTTKIMCHPPKAISIPPSDGPSAVPAADIVPSSPITFPVRFFGTISPTKAMVRAIITAAPSPCTARAAISNASVGATAPRADPTVNTRIPASSNRRRPTMSPSRPTLTTSVVMVSRYARTTHCTCWNGAPNTFARVGRAILTILMPRDDSSMDRDRAARAQRTGSCRIEPPAAAPSGVVTNGIFLVSMVYLGPRIGAARNLGHIPRWRKTHHMHCIHA